MKPITKLLQDWQDGREAAFEELLNCVYDDLKGVAHNLLRQEKDAPFQTTELVHQMFESLVGKGDLDWESRHQFFRLAARAMRRALIEEARKKKALKRGGDFYPETLEEQSVQVERRFDHWLSVDTAIDALERQDATVAQIAELKIFAGFTLEEIAMIMELSLATIKRKWSIGQSWLISRVTQ